MALPPQTKKVIDKFKDLPLEEAAAFVARREARPLVALLNSYYGDFNLKQFQRILRSENDGAIEQIYKDINHAARTYKEPIQEKPKTPSAKKQTDNAFTRTVGELKALGKSGIDLVKAVSIFDPVLLAKSCVTVPTEIITTALSAAGLSKFGRQLAVANISAWGSAYVTGTLTAGFTALGIGSAQASLPSFDPTTMNDFDSNGYAETLDSARLGELARGPLEITVTGGNHTSTLNNDFENATATHEDTYLLSPYLVKKLDIDPQARQYLSWLVDAAQQNNLNPILFANQFFRETRHFKESVIVGPDTSPAGARGFGQFMESTGKKYGLKDDADFFNPEKSIYAAARLMRDLTDDYNGDQILAMAAYNGGPGAVEFVQEKLGHAITGTDWLNYMEKRFAQIGATSPSAWHVETRKYISDITNKDWENEYTRWAQKLQGPQPLNYIISITSPQASAPTSAARAIENNFNG